MSRFLNAFPGIFHKFYYDTWSTRVPKLVAEWLSDDPLMLSFYQLQVLRWCLGRFGVLYLWLPADCVATLCGYPEVRRTSNKKKTAGGLNGLNYFLFFNHTWDVWLRRPRFFDMFGMDWSYQQKDGPGDMNVRKPGPHCKWCLGNGSPPKMSNRFLAVVDILPSGKHSELDNLHV